MERETLYRAVTLPLLVVALLLFAGPATAVEVKDETFGFRLTIPEGYQEVKPAEADADTLYSFASPDPGNPPFAIQIQRMRGTVAVNSNLSYEDIPEAERATTTLENLEWKLLKLDVLRKVQTLPDGGKMVMFAIQYPLRGEAIQLIVGGPQEKAKDVRKVFRDVALSMQNAKALPLPERKSAPAETRDPDAVRKDKILLRFFMLAVSAIILAFLYRFVRWIFSWGKK